MRGGNYLVGSEQPWLKGMWVWDDDVKNMYNTHALSCTVVLYRRANKTF